MLVDEFQSDICAEFYAHQNFEACCKIDKVKLAKKHKLRICIMKTRSIMFKSRAACINFWKRIENWYN